MHLHNKHHTPLFGATPFISQHHWLVLNIVIPFFVMQTTPPCSNKRHYNYRLMPNKAAVLLAVNATGRQQQKGNEHAAQNHYASLP